MKLNDVLQKQWFSRFFLRGPTFSEDWNVLIKTDRNFDPKVQNIVNYSAINTGYYWNPMLLKLIQLMTTASVLHEEAT